MDTNAVTVTGEMIIFTHIHPTVAITERQSEWLQRRASGRLAAHSQDFEPLAGHGVGR